MHDGAPDKHAALQRVLRVFTLPGNRREQPVTRGEGTGARCHEQKTTGAVSVLRHARFEAGLPEERGLLIARNARDRDGMAVDLRGDVSTRRQLRWHDLRQALARHAEHCEQHRVPVHRVQVEEQCAARVGGVCYVMRAVAEFPYEPAIDVAESELATPGSLAAVWNGVQ